eukprot:scaffold47_cov258-Pinguiococcus_pyrenoidosus.AAC.119
MMVWSRQEISLDAVSRAPSRRAYLALLERFRDHLGGLGTVVKTHPAIRNLAGRADLRVGIGGESISGDHVAGKDELDALGGSLLLELLGEVKLVVLRGFWRREELAPPSLSIAASYLDKGRADLLATGLEEGEHHTTADDELVNLLEHGLDHTDLGGDLGSTDDGRERALGLGNGTLEVVKLLLEEEASNGGVEVLGDTLGGGVGTVRGTESVIDEEVEGGSELLGEGRLVGGLLRVEADVLQEDAVAVGHTLNHGLDFIAHAVRSHLHFLLEQLGQAASHGSQAELVLGSVLGAAEVGRKGDLGTLLHEGLDGRHGGADAGVIGDGLAVQGHVEVAANEHRLALEVFLGEVADALLGRRRSRSGHAERRSRAGD